MDGNLDFRMWKSGFSTLSLHYKVDCVEVGLALTASGYFDEGATLKLLDVAVHACNTHSNIFREPILAGKAKIVVPRVAQKEGVNGLGSDGDIRVTEDEVRNLSEALECDRIRTVYPHVALP